MPNDAPNADAKREHDNLAAIAKRKDEAAIKSGEEAAKMVILANGGAVVAVLTFLGNVSGKVTNTQIPPVAYSLRYFAWGVAAGLGAMFFAYLTNLNHTNLFSSYILTNEHPYSQDGPKTWKFNFYSDITHWAAIICGTASLLCFLYGIYDVGNAVSALKFELR